MKHGAKLPFCPWFKAVLKLSLHVFKVCRGRDTALAHDQQRLAWPTYARTVPKRGENGRVRQLFAIDFRLEQLLKAPKII